MSTDEVAQDKVCAVAFTIEDEVFIGIAGESHISLYLRLLQDLLVPEATLDAWTSDDKNHGFITEKGEFISRAEALRRFGTTRSQDLKAQGVFPTLP